MEIKPETLNLSSHGRWVTAFIELPEGYHAADIDPDSVMLNGVVPAEKSRLGDHDRDGVFDLMVKFDRQHTASLMGPGDAVEITVTGIVEGRRFAGADAIRVIRRGNGNGKGAGKGRGRGEHGRRDFAGTDFGPRETTICSVSVYFYHLNHLGTPRAMTDENGNVVWKADYKPFGEAEVAGDAENRFRFPGQYLDGETGLHYNWHRYYDSETGRYLKADPIGLVGGINLFAYVSGNPVNSADIYGLMGDEEGRDLMFWDGETPLCGGGGGGGSRGGSLRINIRGIFKIRTGGSSSTAPKNTRFIEGVKVVDRRTGKVLESTVDLKPTLDRIAQGKSFPHRNDGSIFQNRPLRGQTTPQLPAKPQGYYREYVHPTPGVSGPGPQRIVTGQRGEIYYTPDHYTTFIRVNP